MSKAVTLAVDPMGLALKKDNPYSFSGIASSKGDTPPAAVADADAAPAENQQEKQVSTRGQELRSAAAAAGATRSGNQRDWLSGGLMRTKRKDAAKALLGE